VPKWQAGDAPVDADWARRYARGLAITDFVVIVWAVVGAQLLRFGVSLEEEARAGTGAALTLNYSLISIAIILAWLLALAVFKTRGDRVVGIGATEYRLVAQATLWLFGLGTIVLFLFKVDIARAYVLIALPLGLIALLLSRWLWRQWLNARRRRGRASYRVVLLGSSESVSTIARELARFPAAGYHVVAAIIPGERHGAATLNGGSIPVTTDVDELQHVMSAHAADTLVIASSDELTPERIRRISWSLEPGRQHLVMAPSLTDVGGPRIHTRPVAGLPLMHVETPQYQGAQAFVKRLFDLLGSSIAILLLAVPMLIIAIIVKTTTPGPVLYLSERIGYHGRPFRMLKFRSMHDGANVQLKSLLDAQGGATSRCSRSRKILGSLRSAGSFGVTRSTNCHSSSMFSPAQCRLSARVPRSRLR